MRRIEVDLGNVYLAAKIDDMSQELFNIP